MLKISSVIIQVDESNGQGHVGISEYPLKSKNSAESYIPYHREGSTASGRLLWVLDRPKAHCTPKNIPLAWKTARFKYGPEQIRVLQQVQVIISATLPFGPYNPADLMVLKVSVVEIDIVWRVW